MIKIEKVEVVGLEHAIRGMRNPKNSWDRSDSGVYYFQTDKIIDGDIVCYPEYVVGDNDLGLMKKLEKGGPVHAKYRRMIVVYLDITAPLYWWKEFDTYKVGTVANSCSTMHKLDAYPITREMFSWDNVGDPGAEFWATVDAIIAECERLRQKFKETGDKTYWRALVQMLPNSWMQKRTVTSNYQVARAQYFARRFHKLTEWHILCDVYLNLPYGKEFIGYEKPKKLNKMIKFLLSSLGIQYAEKDTDKELDEEIIWNNINEYFGGN